MCSASSHIFVTGSVTVSNVLLSKLMQVASVGGMWCAGTSRRHMFQHAGQWSTWKHVSNRLPSVTFGGHVEDDLLLPAVI
jgi:hypothetical protein